jgi:hypothetical protein
VTREIDTLGSCRTVFLARPFRPAFATVERWITEHLWKRHILLRRRDRLPGEPLRLEEIALEIRSAHLGLADVTRNDPNVQMELGMMIALQTRVLLLQRSDDRTPLPFDLKGLNLVRYVLKPGPSLLAVSPETGQCQPLDRILDPFVEESLTMDAALSVRAAGPRPTGK